MHQADLLFLPYDRVRFKTYKYALTVVDVASRFKEAEPITSKNADQVADAIAKIYKRSPLNWPKLIKVDGGREFMGKFGALMDHYDVAIQRGIPGVHRSQGIVERFNRSLAEVLFGHQYSEEMLNPKSRNTEWVKRLPDVIKSMNDEETRLIGKKPVEAILLKQVEQSPAAPGVKEIPLNSGKDLVRYLYSPGESQGGERRRATDPIWSLRTFTIKEYTRVKGQPILYYLDDPAPKRSFVRQELQVVPPDTELPPSVK